MKLKPSTGLAFSACALLLASCGSSNSVTNGGSNSVLPNSWINESASSEAVILTWTITGTHAVGSLTVTYLSSSGNSALHDSLSFSGTVSSKSVSLTINRNNIAGTVKPTQLSLSFPQPNGKLSSLVMIPGSTSTYNKEVAKIDSEASSNEQKTQAEQLAQQQTQAQAAQNSLDRQAIRFASGEVSSDLSDIQGEESQLATDVTGMQQAVASEDAALSKTQSYLATTQSMVNTYGTGSGNGVCYEATQDVGYEAAQSVNYDATQNVNYDATQNVLPDISAVQSGIQKLQSDFTSLQSAENAMPGYLPSGTPMSSQVQSAIATASTDIANAVSTTNGYIAQANAYVATAYGYTDTAYKIGNCGSPPSLPVPLSLITVAGATNT